MFHKRKFTFELDLQADVQIKSKVNYAALCKFIWSGRSADLVEAEYPKQLRIIDPDAFALRSGISDFTDLRAGMENCKSSVGCISEDFLYNFGWRGRILPPN